MKKKSFIWTIAIATMVLGLASCGLDMPKEVPSSFETMTIEKEDITVPIKFSAKLKGQADVTISPQVNGQLMRIAVTEGQQVTKGQTLFVIDSRNAQLDLEAAQANLQAALEPCEGESRLLHYNSPNLRCDWSNSCSHRRSGVSSYPTDHSEW